MSVGGLVCMVVMYLMVSFESFDEEAVGQLRGTVGPQRGHGRWVNPDRSKAVSNRKHISVEENTAKVPQPLHSQKNSKNSKNSKNVKNSALEEDRRSHQIDQSKLMGSASPNSESDSDSESSGSQIITTPTPRGRGFTDEDDDVPKISKKRVKKDSKVSLSEGGEDERTGGMATIDEEEELWREVTGFGMTLNVNDPDALPFTVATMKKFRRNASEYPTHWISAPNPPSAPIGKQAWALARTFNFPDEWRARHRPKLFILGTVGTGSLFLEECWKTAMTGNDSNRPYPMSAERWPISRHQTGETIADPFAENGVKDVWGRTGFRRWDPPKEWFVYAECGGAPHPSPLCSHHRARWPPVEPGSDKWRVIDASPETLMSAAAANQTFFDMKSVLSDPTLRPVFIVPTQVPLLTARYDFSVYFKHRIRPFVDYTAYFKDPEGLRTEPSKEELSAIIEADEERRFWEHIDDELAAHHEHPLCKKVVEDPAQFLKEIHINIRTTHEAQEMLTQCLYRMVGDRTERHRRPYFLLSNFYGVGLAHWLATGFSSDQFVQVPTEELRWYTPEQVLSLFEDALPGMKKIKPRCENPASWDVTDRAGETICSGHIAWDKAQLFCNPVDSPAAIPKLAWNFTKALGRETEGEYTVEQVWEISAKMHRATETFMAENEIRAWRMHSGWGKEEQEQVAKSLGQHNAHTSGLHSIEKIKSIKNLEKKIKDPAVLEQIVEERNEG